MSGLLPPNILSYTGQVVVPFMRETFDPNSHNYQFNVPTIWINTNTQKAWILVAKPMNVAVWLEFAGGSGDIISLTGNSGGAVFPTAGNINVVGDGVNTTTVGNPGTSTITVELLGDVATLYTEDSGTAVPSGGNLNIFGINGISTSGAGSTVTINGAGTMSKLDVDAHTAPGTDPVVPNGSGQITLTGAQVAAGTTSNVIRTDSLAANTCTIEIQRSQAVASSTIGDNGVSHYNSVQFSVDANGFVTLAGSGGGAPILGVTVDAHTAPGTSPVVPNSAGNIIVTGGQVAAGTTSNVIRTDSLAANTYTVEIQRSQAVASSTVGDNGVCHFNSNQFSVDGNGFVSLSGGGQAIDSIGVQTGTNPIAPDNTGLVTINGAVVAAGTNPVRSDGTGPNTMALEVQISQAVASTDATKIGLSNFDSSIFSVDANGFTSLSTSFYQTGTFTPTVFGATTAGSTTYVDRIGTYVRLGNTVFVACAMSISTSTGTGDAVFGGLPFTCKNDQSYYGTMVVSSNGFWPWPAGRTQVQFQVFQGTNTGKTNCLGSNQSNTFLQMDNAGATNCSLHYSAWYTIS